MPMPGKGMLITSMDIDPSDEAEFNIWYDREHLAERVAIKGFNEARRWIAVDAKPKYFCTYSTERFEALTSPDYKQALANQTEWSNKMISRFKNMIRAVGRITVSRGQGRGSAMAVVRLRPGHTDINALRDKLQQLMDPGMLPGIISMHLIESDPALSKSLTEPDKPNPGASDWFVLIDGTDIASVRGLAQTRFKDPGVPIITLGTYHLMWDLSKSDL